MLYTGLEYSQTCSDKQLKALAKWTDCRAIDFGHSSDFADAFAIADVYVDSVVVVVAAVASCGVGRCFARLASHGGYNRVIYVRCNYCYTVNSKSDLDYQVAGVDWYGVE